MAVVPPEVEARIRRTAPEGHHVVPGSTAIPFFGNQPTARLATVGINPSRIEFQKANHDELDGARRRFETLASLGLASIDGATDEDVAAIYKRCVEYFDDVDVAYWAWFKRLENIIQPLDAASYLDGTACHLDLVQWATDPVWSKIEDKEVQSRLAEQDIEFLLGQLSAPQLEIVYLNGKKVAEVLGEHIPLESRTAEFRPGSVRTFYRGTYEGTAIVGCSAFITNARVALEDMGAFDQWIADECRTDLDSLGHVPRSPGSTEAPSADMDSLRTEVDVAELPLALAPNTRDLVSAAREAGAHIHIPEGEQTWFGLRGQTDSRIGVYVRRSGLTVLLPPDKAEPILNSGLGNLERQNASTTFVRFAEESLQGEAKADVGRYVLEALELV